MSKAAKPIEIWRVNAFTDTPFTGNPAGVVPDAEGLSEARMQAIAREVNDISETAFILPPRTADADLRLRFFTSTTEVDLCGHATISALFTLHWRGDLGGDTPSRTIRAETPVGALTLGLEFRDGELQWAVMEQLEPEFAPATGAQHAASVLGLPESAIAPEPPIGCCRTGIWVCYVPLTSLDALAGIRLERERIELLWPENPDFAGVYAFTLIDDHLTQGRFFSLPRYGILEDPVTGTASGGLGAYLMQHGRVAQNGELVARQGHEMGRPGVVHVTRNSNGRMSIRGRAVAVIRGEVLA
ncbi:PhzF family phenazine biosynthesis protein [Elongatibacter sediminis]|uniref:PhzF family phenazine biosynthesis protein n=1 Tax=Elongatibacter sediminis TaxID=3119006 RepID=A0AAW9R4M5_9GAMM